MEVIHLLAVGIGMVIGVGATWITRDGLGLPTALSWIVGVGFGFIAVASVLMGAFTQ